LLARSRLQEPRVALFDATNTTRARRATLLARNRKETNATLLFVESICDDPEILRRNYEMKLQNNGGVGCGACAATCGHLCPSVWTRR
jgi:predicted kinase